jgi:hypothetical protein
VNHEAAAASEEAPHDVPVHDAPAAPPSAVQDSVADGPMFHEAAPAAEVERESSASPGEDSSDGRRAPTQAEEDDPSRPKRSGWWRRARATFVGE